MSEKQLNTEEYELMRYDNKRFHGFFTLNISSIGTMLYRGTIVIILVMLIDTFVLEPFIGITISGGIFQFLADSGVSQAFGREFAVERIVFAGIVFILSTAIIFPFIPNAQTLDVAVCNYSKRTLDFDVKIPITHKDINNLYNGNRKIVLIGESPYFMTHNLRKEKSVMANEIRIFPDRMEIYLTKAYTYNDFEVLAVEDSLEQIPDHLAESLRENVAWRNFFSIEVKKEAVKTWKIASTILDPTINFRSLELRSGSADKGINFDVKPEVKETSESKEGVENVEE